MRQIFAKICLGTLFLYWLRPTLGTISGLFWFTSRRHFIVSTWRKIITTNFQEFERFEKNRNNLLWHLFSEKWYYKMLFRIKFWTTFYCFDFFAVIRRVIIVQCARPLMKNIANHYIHSFIFYCRIRFIYFLIYLHK